MLTAAFVCFYAARRFADEQPLEGAPEPVADPTCTAVAGRWFRAFVNVNSVPTPPGAQVTTNNINWVFDNPAVAVTGAQVRQQQAWPMLLADVCSAAPGLQHASKQLYFAAVCRRGGPVPSTALRPP